MLKSQAHLLTLRIQVCIDVFQWKKPKSTQTVNNFTDDLKLRGSKPNFPWWCTTDATQPWLFDLASADGGCLQSFPSTKEVKRT